MGTKQQHDLCNGNDPRMALVKGKNHVRCKSGTARQSRILEADFPSAFALRGWIKVVERDEGAARPRLLI